MQNLNKSTVIAASLLALAGGVWTASQLRGTRLAELKTGTLLQSPRPMAEFTLTDQDGKPFTRASLQGHWTLLFAGYTHCPDVCPTTLALMKTLEQKLAAERRDPRVVFLSVDPERDSPQRLKEYVSAFDPSFTGVTGAPAQIEALCRSAGLAYSRVPEAGGASYSMDHSAALTLIDPSGRIAGYFQPPFQLEPLVTDLRSVLPAHS